MQIHTFHKIVKRSQKRLGRGHGSGRGKTAGRGTKGQNARGTVPPHFEGGQLSVMKRLPFLRGKRRNKSQHLRPDILSVGQLENLVASKTPVTLDVLKKHGLVDQASRAVKILDGGKLTKAFTVSVPCSEGATKAIEKVGGSVVS